MIQQLERSIAERDHRISEVDANAIAQADELRAAHQACRTADQTREVMEQEIRVLREHIAQLNEDLADRDQVRVRMEKLESAQDRVHQLEVELSDREAGHRGMIQQLERSIAERDRRIEELVPVTHLLREKESELKEWRKNYARTVQEHNREVAKLQDQCAAQEQLRAQHLLDEQQLHERDEQIASLHRQLHEIQTERQGLLKTVQSIPEKDEHIDRLRKHLRDIRAELRAKTASATPISRPTRQNGAEPGSQGALSKVGKDSQADDLKKINGIGPTFAQTLNKMGTRTFIQIARWKPEDIQKIAKKLDTDPERIKRDNWIADAKKQHYRKYGERV
jgi:predicted flap endonuclease-1-like 5' DNA nuclease